jgi:hypothetical protein
MRSSRRFVAALFALALGGCPPFAVAPPSQIARLRSVETTRPDHVQLRGSGGAHGWQGGDAPVADGSAGISVGIAENAEVQFDGTAAFIGGLGQRTVNPIAGMGRVGVMHRVERWLALEGGIGGGAGPWGGFVAGDLGMIFAYENPDFVPFFAARMQLSGPVLGQTEVATTTGSSGMTTTTLVSPSPTMWFQPSAGFRIPFCHGCGESDARVSLVAAIVWTEALTLDAQGRGLGFLGGEGGLLLEL